MKEVGSPPPVPSEVSSPPSTGEGGKKKLVTQDTLDSPSLSQTPSVSSEDPLSPVVRRKYRDYLHQGVYNSGFAHLWLWLSLSCQPCMFFTFLSFRVWTRNSQLSSIWRCQGDRWEAASGSPSGACVFRVLQREDPGTTSSHAASSQTSMWDQFLGLRFYVMLKDLLNIWGICLFTFLQRTTWLRLVMAIAASYLNSALRLQNS